MSIGLKRAGTHGSRASAKDHHQRNASGGRPLARTIRYPSSMGRPGRLVTCAPNALTPHPPLVTEKIRKPTFSNVPRGDSNNRLPYTKTARSPGYFTDLRHSTCIQKLRGGRLMTFRKHELDGVHHGTRITLRVTPARHTALALLDLEATLDASRSTRGSPMTRRTPFRRVPLARDPCTAGKAQEAAGRPGRSLEAETARRTS